MQAFVPKTRRPKFNLKLAITDLNNVPLVTGTCYVKWHLPSSTSADHRGHTPKALIREHKVTWNYTRTIPVRLTVDKNGMLQDSEIHFEVLQEYSPSARAERIVLGTVKLNLSEYVGEGRDEDGDLDGGIDKNDNEEEGIVRRYLMQESKINSTLKIGIFLPQIEGDTNYIAPPLKTAPVFGGIAGIMTAETGTTDDDGGGMPAMSSKAQEGGKLQDLYRRNLAASWAAQAGELPADECIEDIFSGGDGWGEHGQENRLKTPTVSYKDVEDDLLRTPRAGDGAHRRYFSGSTITEPKNNGTSHRSHAKKTSYSSFTSNPTSGAERSRPNGPGGRSSIDEQVKSSTFGKINRKIQSNELNEFMEREDLRSWTIRAPN